MITVAIIGILASIAIPNFISYSLKAKRAELPLIIGGIAVAQNALLATIDAYANVAVPDPPLPVTNVRRPWVINPCPAACSKSNPAACTEFTCTGYQPTGVLYGSYDSPSLAPGAGVTIWEFAVGAVSDVDVDLNIAVMLYESGNSAAVGQVPDALAAMAPCGPAVPSTDVFDCKPYAY
jgi:type II secretory pathway pseudopilin PulG